MCVVLASGGYPTHYRKGFTITGHDTDFGKDVIVFHSGTTKKFNQVITNGGRVFGVTGLGKSFAEASSKAYTAITSISFQGAQYRTDIGRRGNK